MILNPTWLLNKKMWVPREYAYEIQDILLNVPEFGYDFVLKKSKCKKRFKKCTKYVAYFINVNGGIDHFEVQEEEIDYAYKEYLFEPEEELDFNLVIEDDLDSEKMFY